MHYRTPALAERILALRDILLTMASFDAYYCVGLAVDSPGLCSSEYAQFHLNEATAIALNHGFSDVAECITDTVLRCHSAPEAAVPALNSESEQPSLTEGAGDIPFGKTELQAISNIIAVAVSEINSQLTIMLSATRAAVVSLPADHPALPLVREAEAATRQSAHNASLLLAFARGCKAIAVGD